jgi:hypothetical protein
LVMRYVNAVRSVSKWGLHPLIHTFTKFNLAQDIWVVSVICSQDTTMKLAVSNEAEWRA